MYKIWLKLASFILIFRGSKSRALYWNIRSHELKNRYQLLQDDYARLRLILQNFKIQEVFDIGCGFGRLIPLWLEFKDIRIVCTDISSESMKLARGSYGDTKIEFLTVDILETTVLPSAQPNLAVCSKVFGALNFEEAQFGIKKLMESYDYIYLCEKSAPLYAPNKGGLSWHLHDYERIFSSLGAVNISNDPDYYLIKSNNFK